MTNLVLSHNADIGLSGRIRTALANLRAEWTKYQRYLSIRRELEALSLRELDDIGIPPRDIANVAFEGAYGKPSAKRQ